MAVAVFTDSRYALGLGACCYALAALASYRLAQPSSLAVAQAA